MAIMLAIQNWRHYLIGCHFMVWSDQQSLWFLMEQRDMGGEYRHWVRKLLGYDFEIQFKSGITNKAADDMSSICNFGK